MSQDLLAFIITVIIVTVAVLYRTRRPARKP